MKKFSTVVLERLKYFSDDFETEPYEVGWASEAIFFLRLHEIEGLNVKLNPKVQISSDGVIWVDEGTIFESIENIGDYFAKVSHFGGWLRLKTSVQGTSSKVKITIQLVLKE